MIRNKTFFTVAIVILLSNCSTIFPTIDARGKSFITYNNIENMQLLVRGEKYKKKNFFLVTQQWIGVDYPRIKKELGFVKNKDTMKLYCFCRELNNYYLKDLKFKKGEYFVNLPKKINWVKGSDIPTDKSFQNIQFKRTYHINPIQRTSSIEDLYFKDMYFQVIDFSDTLNVKLKNIDEKEFWNNSFFPRINNE